MSLLFGQSDQCFRDLTISQNHPKVKSYKIKDGELLDRLRIVLYCNVQMSLGISALKPLEFEWDEGSQDKNWVKHVVTPEECEEVFSNKPLHFLRDIVHSREEARYTALGKTLMNRKLVVTFTIRAGRIRVISARAMSKKERRLYEEKSKIKDTSTI